MRKRALQKKIAEEVVRRVAEKKREAAETKKMKAEEARQKAAAEKTNMMLRRVWRARRAKEAEAEVEETRMMEAEEAKQKEAAEKMKMMMINRMSVYLEKEERWREEWLGWCNCMSAQTALTAQLCQEQMERWLTDLA